MEEKVINDRRQLRKVAPLTFAICVGFALFNILVAGSLYNTPASHLPLVIINKTLSPQFWASVFLVLSVSGILSLALNRWKYIRRVLGIGLCMKSLWLYAFLLRVPSDGFGPVIIWAFVSYIQFITLVLFPEGD